MIKPAAITLLCVGALSVQAQTVEETLAQLKPLIDWADPPDASRYGDTSVTMIPDSCTFRLKATSQTDGKSGPISGYIDISVPFADLAVEELLVSDGTFSNSELDLHTKDGLETITETISFSGTVEAVQPVRDWLLKRPEDASCTDTTCYLELRARMENGIPIGSKTAIQYDQIKTLITQLESLCQKEGK